MSLQQNFASWAKTRGISRSAYGNLEIINKYLFFDGLAAGKFQIDFLAKNQKETKLSKGLTKRLIEGVLDLPVTIRTTTENKCSCSLFEASKHLAKLYLQGSTVHALLNSPLIQSWWVTTGTPVLFIELKQHEGLNLPFQYRKIPLPPNQKLDLRYSLITHRGFQFPLWVIQGDREPPNKTRDFKAVLLKLHNEYEGLRIVFTLITKNKLNIKPYSAESDGLQEYLNISTKKISRLENTWLKIFNEELVIAARESFNIAEQGKLEILLEQLSNLNIRRNIHDKIKSFSVERSNVLTINIKEAHMSIQDNSRTTNISNISGSIINVESILENTVQQINSMPRTSEEEKGELSKLVQQLKEILKQVPNNQAEEASKAANRVDTAVSEASKPKPDKEVVEFNLESLKKAAENIAAVLPTVLPIAIQIAERISKSLP